MLIHEVNSEVKKAETHEQKARLVPLSFTMEGSSDSKRISTDAILMLTSLPNIFMDVVASCTTRCRSAYTDRTRVQQRLKFILPPVMPRNLKPRNIILGTLSNFSRKFPPTKITHYTVSASGYKQLLHLTILTKIRMQFGFKNCRI